MTAAHRHVRVLAALLLVAALLWSLTSPDTSGAVWIVLAAIALLPPASRVLIVSAGGDPLPADPCGLRLEPPRAPPLF